MASSSSCRGTHEDISQKVDAGPSYGGPGQGWTAFEERLFKRLDDMKVQANSRHEENLRNHEENRNQIRLLTKRIAHMISRRDQGGRSEPTPGRDINFPSPSKTADGQRRVMKAANNETEEAPVLAPKKEAPKEEPVANSSPLKSTTAVAVRGTQSTSKSSEGKRKINGDESETTPNNAPHKKVKTGNDVKSVKEGPGSSAKSSAPTKDASPQASSKSAPASPTGPVTEEEIRILVLQKSPATAKDIMDKFKSRLKLKEDQDAFAAMVKRILRIHKINGATYIYLRETDDFDVFDILDLSNKLGL